MKVYLQGLITGGVFIFAFMVLIGHTDARFGALEDGFEMVFGATEVVAFGALEITLTKRETLGRKRMEQRSYFTFHVIIPRPVRDTSQMEQLMVMVCKAVKTGMLLIVMNKWKIYSLMRYLYSLPLIGILPCDAEHLHETSILLEIDT